MVDETRVLRLLRAVADDLAVLRVVLQKEVDDRIVLAMLDDPSDLDQSRVARR